MPLPRDGHHAIYGVQFRCCARRDKSCPVSVSNVLVALHPLPFCAVRRQANQRGKVAAAPVDGGPMGVGAGGGVGGSNGDDDMPKKKVKHSGEKGFPVVGV